MKASISHQEYQRLELISDSESTKAGKAELTMQQSLQQLWHTLTTYLNSTEPRVWRTVDQDAGQLVWNAYDPTTNRRGKFSNEQDLRVWLEERYYRPGAEVFNF